MEDDQVQPLFLSSFLSSLPPEHDAETQHDQCLHGRRPSATTFLVLLLVVATTSDCSHDTTILTILTLQLGDCLVRGHLSQLIGLADISCKQFSEVSCIVGCALA